MKAIHHKAVNMHILLKIHVFFHLVWFQLGTSLASSLKPTYLSSCCIPVWSCNNICEKTIRIFNISIVSRKEPSRNNRGNVLTVKNLFFFFFFHNGYLFFVLA